MLQPFVQWVARPFYTLLLYHFSFCYFYLPLGFIVYHVSFLIKNVSIDIIY